LVLWHTATEKDSRALGPEKASLRAPDLKQRLSTSMGQLTPVRNEIAHVREIEPDRLIRANLACNEVRALARAGVSR
jgi:hypothetical protein